MHKPFILTALLLLAGCVTRPDGSSAYLEEETYTPARREARNAEEPGTSAQEELEEILRKPALSLDDLLRIARRRHPGIGAARQRRRAAQGRVRQAGLYPNPTLELEAEGIPDDELGLHRSENSVGIVQPIILGGRRRAASEAAASEGDALDFRSQWREREILAGVREAHVECLFLRESEKGYRALQEEMRGTVEIAENRFQQGAASETDLLKSRLEADRLELEVRRIEREKEGLAGRLRFLLGGAEVPLEKIGGELPETFPFADRHRLREEVREEHPLVRAARLDWKAARERLELEEARRIPDVGLRLAYGRNTDENESFIEAGVSIPLPLFDRNQGRIAEARHLAENARLELVETEARMISDLEEVAARDAQEADRVETLREKILPAARRILEQTREAYRGGKASLLDLLDAQRAWIEAKISYLEWVREWNRARVELWKLTGGVS